MKKIIALILILILITPSVCFGRVGKSVFLRPIKFNTYGMVFVYIKNAPIVYPILRDAEINPKYVWELKAKTLGLVNKGEIFEIHIRIPLKDSYVRIYYKERFYDFKLEAYSLKYDCILFIFRGDM